VLVGPGGDSPRRFRAANRRLRTPGVTVGAVALIAIVAGHGPGLLAGTPEPRPSTSPSSDRPYREWTGDAARPSGNAFVPSPTRLLRLPAI
jgi:hypothetical protein